jgi:hypothetical protein
MPARDRAAARASNAAGLAAPRTRFVEVCVVEGGGSPEALEVEFAKLRALSEPAPARSEREAGELLAAAGGQRGPGRLFEPLPPAYKGVFALTQKVKRELIDMEAVAGEGAAAGGGKGREAEDAAAGVGVGVGAAAEAAAEAGAGAEEGGAEGAGMPIDLRRRLGGKHKHKGETVIPGRAKVSKPTGSVLEGFVIRADKLNAGDPHIFAATTGMRLLTNVFPHAPTLEQTVQIQAFVDAAEASLFGGCDAEAEPEGYSGQGSLFHWESFIGRCRGVWV